MIRYSVKSVVDRLRLMRKKTETTLSERRTAPPFPYYICMETTNACNLRCIQCLYKGGTTDHYHGRVGYIDVNFAVKVLDQLCKHGSGVMLNGDGEALLHPRFHDIARYAVQLGLPNVYFNTNGTLLNRQFTDKFLTYFRGAVSISLDGFKESHERIRVGSSYEKVIDNLEYLRTRVLETQAPINISVAFCNYDQPKGERDDFVKYWIDRVASVTVGEVYDQDYRIISRQINRQDELKRIQCGVPWETFIVRWDGCVIPCSNCFSLGQQGNFILGDARTQSLEEIWHGAPITDLRERSERWQLDGTTCQNCERWNMYVQFDDRIENGMIVSRSGVFTTYRKQPST